MKALRILTVFMFMLAGAAWAQDITFPPGLDRLAAKAAEVVDVTMGRPMLEFAARFLSDKDPDDAQAKKLIRKLNGVYVKSFEFDKPGGYSMADVEPFRAQLKSPVWSRMVEARSRRDGETVEVYFKLENGVMNGLAIIAAEPQELTLVHIDGPLDPEDLASLGGQFGIPKIDTGKKGGKDAAGSGKAVAK